MKKVLFVVFAVLMLTFAAASAQETAEAEQTLNFSTLGDMQVISFSAAGLDDRYSLDAESVSSELADLLCSIIFDPAITDGKFNTEDLEQERRQLIDAIDADFNDKRTYAINRCIECMCRNEPFSIGRFGSREDVSKLTQDDVYYAWQQLLENSRTELAMLGSADPQNAYDRFKTYFENKPRRMTASTVIIDKPEEVKHITETEEISQSKLVMGFRTACPDTKEKYVTSSLMSAILGGTPTSKLFLNVAARMEMKRTFFECLIENLKCAVSKAVTSKPTNAQGARIIRLKTAYPLLSPSVPKERVFPLPIT